MPKPISESASAPAPIIRIALIEISFRRCCLTPRSINARAIPVPEKYGPMTRSGRRGCRALLQIDRGERRRPGAAKLLDREAGGGHVVRLVPLRDVVLHVGLDEEIG